MLPFLGRDDDAVLAGEVHAEQEGGGAAVARPPRPGCVCVHTVYTYSMYYRACSKQSSPVNNLEYF
jgi:hypothetical protein